MVKEISRCLKKRKPKSLKVLGPVVQQSCVCFLQGAVFIDGGNKRPFRDDFDEKWPTSREVGRNYDATCYAYEKSVASWKVG